MPAFNMSMSSDLRKFIAPEFVFGPGALKLAGRYVRSLSANKVLIVTDPGVRAAGWVKRVEASVREVDIPYVIFDCVTPNPKDLEVMAGVQVYNQEQCDLILAVGGGSPMDCAKGIGICSANGGSIVDYEGIDAVPVPGPPLMCIPTTAGSAADLSQFAIVSNTTNGFKMAIVSKMVVPDASLIDPLTTMTMSAELTVNCGLDVLSHAFESYVSNLGSPVTDLDALESARLVAANLPQALAHPNNVSFRRAMAMASTLAGLAFSNASLGLCHAMGHAVGGMSDCAHGLSQAILLEHVVRFNYEAAADRYQALAKAVGADPAGGAEALFQWLAAFRQTLGICGGLGALGLERASIPKMAARALCDPCMGTNPRPLSQQDMETLYGCAF